MGKPRWPSQKRGSLSAEESAALLQQFVDLGYIDEVSSDPTEAAAETHRENKWNLARAYLYSGKYDGALPLLEDCFHAYPERTDYAQTLARTQLHLGLADEAEETLAICLEAARQQAEEDAIEASTFTIVSGLPRSGTSLMMQMLTAAGMEAMTDGKRPADEDNLQGYFEWEDIKSLRKNPRLIEQAEGKVIKVISALIPQLPPKHRYRILFMKRPVSEIVDSQWAMLSRNGKKPRSEKDHLIQTQQTHLDQTLAQLRQRNNVDLLEIDYPALVAHPQGQLPALIAFLGDTAPHPAYLTTPIRPELHRNK